MAHRSGGPRQCRWRCWSRPGPGRRRRCGRARSWPPGSWLPCSTWRRSARRQRGRSSASRRVRPIRAPGSWSGRRLCAPGTRCCWTTLLPQSGPARASRSGSHRPARRGRAGCCCLTSRACQGRRSGICGLPRCWGGVSAPRWRPRSPGSRRRMRQRRKKRSPLPGWAATPVRAGPNSAMNSSARPCTSWPPPSGRSCTRRRSGSWRLAVSTRPRRLATRWQPGAPGAARRHLQAAVDLAGPPAPAELVFDLGRALIAGGDHAAGVARYEELLARAGLPGETRLAILGQLSQARMYAGRIAEAEAAMEEAQRLAGPGRRDLTAGAMVDHAAQVMVTYGWIRAGPLAVRARWRAGEGSAPVPAAAAAVWAVGTYFSGDPAGLEVAEAAARSAATAPSWRPAGTPWWDPVAHYASLALSAERFGDARRLLDSILEAAERRSDPMAVAQALLYRTTLRWRLGQLDEGLALSARLLEAADLVPVMTPNAAAGRALILLDLGRLDEAEDWCARADEAAAGRGDSLGYAVMASHLPRGTLALRRGDLDGACATFTALWEIADALEVRDPGTVPWAADALAAYLACGREADAGRLIDWLAPAAGALPARWAKVVVAAGRAALAERNGDPETARRRYAEALALQEEMPIQLARAQVLTDYGAFLYRQGDARQARQALAEALRLAESCGAGWHAERARVELRRAAARTATTPPGQLTPQEAAVARLARAGKTNREIAAQLYLTVNTVETHLRHVYQKLGIHRRVELLTLPDAETEAASSPAPP